MATADSFNAKLLEDYREYPGGKWWIAELVLDCLIGNGLRRHHRLVDVGCGPLRIGRHLIAFLDANCYTGIEPEVSMLEAGLTHELSGELRSLQHPTFLTEQLGKTRLVADWALGWDVFNHLSADQLRVALTTITADNWLMNVHLGDVDRTLPKDSEGWSYRYADAKTHVYTPNSLETLVADAGYELRVLLTFPSGWEGFPFSVLRLVRPEP
jgi:hypothetical protein